MNLKNNGIVGSESLSLADEKVDLQGLCQGCQTPRPSSPNTNDYSLDLMEVEEQE